MQSKEVLDYVCKSFEKISQTSSRTQKIEQLKWLATFGEEVNGVTTRLLSFALDWYIHFGIRELPKPKESVPDPSWNDFELLAVQMSQGYKTNEAKQIASDLIHSYPDEITRKWLARVLLKDLRMGVEYKTVNKIWPKLIKIFECQLADEIKDLSKLYFPVYGEPKVDGVRCLAIVKNGQVHFISRSGNELCNCGNIATDILGVVGDNEVVLDGELYCISFNKTMSIVTRDVSAPDPELLSALQYHAFDLLRPDEFHTKICRRPFWERRQLLDDLIGDDHRYLVKTTCKSFTSQENLEIFNETCLTLGWEGIMIKDPNSNYDFKRSESWLKHKPFETGEYYATGKYGGTGRHAAVLGGLTLYLGDNKFCNVGGGFSDQQRADFQLNPPLGKAIEVKFKGFTPDGLLREPVFLRVRHDLPTCEL